MSKTSVATRQDEGQLYYSEDQIPEGFAPGEGVGISDDPNDNLIPMISVLQPLSPQLDETNSKYIEGAKAGMIMLKNSPEGGLVPADVGFNFQMCHFKKVWIEWVDRERGGGFAAMYNDKDGKPDFAKAKVNPDNKFEYINPETGNKIQDHRNHVGYVILKNGNALPAVISYHGAGISESKKWMATTPRHHKNGSRTNAADFLWHMVATLKSNAKGRWYDLEAKRRLGLVSPEQQKKGLELAAMHARGEVNADMASGQNDEGSNSDAM